MVRAGVAFAFSVLVAAAPTLAGGTSLLTWDFGSTSGSSVSLASTSNAAGVGAATLTRGAAFTPDDVYIGAGRGSFNTNNSSSPANDLPSSITRGHFAEFSVALDATYEASISSVNVYAYSQNRERTLALAYSLDGFATAPILVSTRQMPNSFDGSLLSFDTTGAAGLQAFTGTASFRMYILEDSSSFEQRGFGNVAGANDDLVVNGTANVVVPLPAAVFGGLALMGATALRRRQPGA